jgi:hypothetical protein
VVQRFKQATGAFVRGGDLYTDCALGNGREHFIRLDRAGDVLGHAKPVQAGAGEKRRSGHALGQLAQPGLDVAAEPDNVEVGPDMLELRHAPH